MCKLLYVIRYFGRTWSSWLVVIITVERYIIVRFPLHVTTVLTTKRAKLVCLLEVAMALMLSSYPLYTVGLRQWDTYILCLVTDNRVYNIMSWIVLRAGNLLVAGTIVTTFTVLIIYHMMVASRDRYRMVSNQNSNQSREAQMTRTLIAVAILFVVLRLPFVISYYIELHYSSHRIKLDPWHDFALFAVNQVANVLAVTNYAINFFLYCLCGSAFRRELRKACRKRPQKQRTPATAQAPLNSGSIMSDKTTLTYISPRTSNTSAM